MPHILFFTLFFIIYGSANYYIGLRAWQAFGQYIPSSCAKLYWLALWGLALAYIASKAGQKILPDLVYDGLTYIGAYWLAIVYYGFLLLAIVDTVRMLDRLSPFLPLSVKSRPAVAGALVIIAVLGIVACGAWNARQPVIRRYDITIAKQSSLPSVRIAVLSDVHLGNIIDNKRLAELVALVRTLNPDMTLLLGDTIDAEIKPFIAQNMGETLRQLRPPLGVYAILGNHEYIGREIETTISQLEQAHITVLRDSCVKVADGFYLVGRDERSRHRYGESPRQPLKAIMQGIDRSLPILLLDHQPQDMAEAQTAGADLQLSGHTHRGQLFPNQLITGSVFEIDWGYLQKDTLQIIVSSGFGTWGPPIRTSSRPEIIDLHITFTKTAPNQKD